MQQQQQQPETSVSAEEAGPFAWNVAGAALRQALAELTEQENLSAEARALCEAQFEASAQAAASQAIHEDILAQDRETSAAEGVRPRKRRRRRTGKLRVAPAGHRRKAKPAGHLTAQVHAFRILGDDVAFDLRDLRLATRYHGAFQCSQAGLTAASVSLSKPGAPRLWTGK
ncbi:Hypothetical Protein FCC1311_022242 [Hondaea fermentalgiana]|uniref:Uncharacterized protein n=1 Tax=Hondaea fermentalgiana TaxID=2315210 RepID=A0A2R5GDY4_9STRA|nr:Hypothetical Protein FCC1311_022242 [Hondaea fermentalgiana]|eukprot:GBG26004.1 Hypothetical Protein FCC1311_022242 [Hondaea fermentalgiana]